MDILTQGLLGGVLARSGAKKTEAKMASFVGMFAGLLADADILISSSSDPLLNIEYHRHFTHSLFFIPFGAMLALIFLWPFLHRHISNARLYLFCLLGYSMSGVLDACTSYGTHLLWPLSDERVAFNIISIIDPVFTLILLIAFLFGLRNRTRKIAFIGLFLCVGYLLIGFAQQQRAYEWSENLIAKRGHTVDHHIVKPTLGNLLLWRSVYIYDDRIYVDAIRVALPGNNKVIEGDSVARFSTRNKFPQLDKDSILYTDIQRFIKFSNGFVAFDPSQQNVLGDMRYSMLPDSVKPLWGIVINTDQPDKHADYLFFRDNSKNVRQSFVDMLFDQ